MPSNVKTLDNLFFKTDNNGTVSPNSDYWLKKAKDIQKQAENRKKVDWDKVGKIKLV